ncbi:GNAT family N-acetyltransferase [Lentilitoribacter sp. Alg239-R112]|uniref:GNAT family N-acetyltransferase n=1 Tax=Lentilitoribacter sp. Alg239-R112 TaxID=2305987 RepID=UPI0013A69BF9|nr:GNAT family N-acetyltransferase [Lentilitoribacter sp. Alg239-R112]
MVVPSIDVLQAAATNQIEVSALRNFDFSSDEYAVLYNNSSASVFQHPIWLSEFYTNLASEREAEALVIVGRDVVDSSLLFVLPLIERHLNFIRLIEAADLGVSDYSSPIVAPQFLETHRQSDQFFQLIADAIGHYDVLRIKPIRKEKRMAWRCFFDFEFEKLNFSAHATCVSAPYDDWRFEAFGKSHANYIDRKKRKIERYGDVKFTLLNNEADIDDALSFLIAQRKGRFEGDEIQNDYVENFYKSVAKRGIRTGYSKTYSLDVNESTIGVVFGVAYRNCYHYLLIGCDYERFGKFSPGFIMYDEIMRDWVNAGGDTFDFTIGDEPFKEKFAAKSTQMYQILHAGSLIGRLAKYAYEFKNGE